jgi:hypothetical protein
MKSTQNLVGKPHGKWMLGRWERGWGNNIDKDY